MRIMRIGFTTVVVVGHAVVVVASMIVATEVRYGDGSPPRWGEFFANPWLALAGYVVLALVIFQWSGLYRFDERWTMGSDLWKSARAVGILALVTLGLLYVFKLDEVSRLFLALFFVMVWAGISLTTVAVRAFYSQRRASGKGTRHVLIVGTDPSVLPLMDNLLVNHPELGVRITGYLGYDQGLDADIAYLGSPRDLPRILETHIVDEVIVALRPGDLYELDAIVHAAREQGKTVRIPLPSMGYSISAGELETLDGTPLLTVSSGPARSLAFATKRLVDIVLATVALVVLAPVMAAIALTIALREGRPILYTDHRAGIHGRTIAVHKFRTMVRGANDMRRDLAVVNDREGPHFKLDLDPRVTRLGAFLRRTSLDELPQFWDVFVGSMSIVGPRAQPFDEVAGYDAWHRRRLSVKPGITGLWQVRARQDPSFDTRARLDMEYIDTWSPLLDVRIMAQTIPAVLRSTGS